MDNRSDISMMTKSNKCPNTLLSANGERIGHITIAYMITTILISRVNK